MKAKYQRFVRTEADDLQSVIDWSEQECLSYPNTSILIVHDNDEFAAVDYGLILDGNLNDKEYEEILSSVLLQIDGSETYNISISQGVPLFFVDTYVRTVELTNQTIHPENVSEGPLLVSRQFGRCIAFDPDGLVEDLEDPLYPIADFCVWNKRDSEFPTIVVK